MARPPWLSKLKFPLLVVGIVVVSATVGWLISKGSSYHAPARHVASHRLPKGWSYIVIARHPQLRVWPEAGAAHPDRVLTNQLTAGEPLSMLVHHRRPGWYQVYLPTRPNGALGWVRDRDVKLATTAYTVVAELVSRELLLYRNGRPFRRFTVGVGRAVTPTPAGTYFITELLRQPDPNGLYGPYAFGLSAYSGVLQHFGQGGNGQIGIHGTNQPQLLGTDVSHGCIRLRNPDIIWLTKRLPLGTPVKIIWG